LGEIYYIDLAKVLGRPEETIVNGMRSIEEKVAEILPQRIVIDPITVINAIIAKDYRKFLYDLASKLKNWNCTALLIDEVILESIIL
jgi:KaiC/GvpD/RAD55 family RecA-like ATPase